MFIKWSPQRNEIARIVYKQPSKDILEIVGKDSYDFTSELIEIFDITEVEEIGNAFRKDGKLYIELLYFYNKTDRHIWEGKKELDYIDYGEQELLLP